LDFALGPFVTLNGVTAEANAGVAGIQSECDCHHDEQFHALGLMPGFEF
jgi:hypothetical protein